MIRKLRFNNDDGFETDKSENLTDANNISLENTEHNEITEATATALPSENNAVNIVDVVINENENAVGNESKQNITAGNALILFVKQVIGIVTLILLIFLVFAIPAGLIMVPMLNYSGFFKYKNGIKIPVVCQMFDRIKHRCVLYSKELTPVNINLNRLHFKRPVNFYHHFTCLLSVYNTYSSKRFTASMPCVDNNNTIQTKINPFSIYNHCSGIGYLLEDFGNFDCHIPEIIIQASAKDNLITETKAVPLHVYRVIQKSY